MFKKGVSTSKTHPLGGKDVKKFKLDLQKKHPDLTDEQRELLFPGKSTITVSKLSNKAIVYSNDHADPIMFDPNGHGDTLIPTVRSEKC